MYRGHEIKVEGMKKRGRQKFGWKDKISNDMKEKSK